MKIDWAGIGFFLVLFGGIASMLYIVALLMFWAITG